ncbi:hypothetical protein LguiA_003154 [Lonicera macranthoides]
MTLATIQPSSDSANQGREREEEYHVLLPCCGLLVLPYRHQEESRGQIEASRPASEALWL